MILYDNETLVDFRLIKGLDERLFYPLAKDCHCFQYTNESWILNNLIFDQWMESGVRDQWGLNLASTLSSKSFILHLREWTINSPSPSSSLTRVRMVKSLEAIPSLIKDRIALLSAIRYPLMTLKKLEYRHQIVIIMNELTLPPFYHWLLTLISFSYVFVIVFNNPLFIRVITRKVAYP